MNRCCGNKMVIGDIGFLNIKFTRPCKSHGLKPSFFGEYGSWFKTGLVASLIDLTGAASSQVSSWDFMAESGLILKLKIRLSKGITNSPFYSSTVFQPCKNLPQMQNSGWLHHRDQHRHRLLTLDGIFITSVVRDRDITDQWKVDAATPMYWFIMAPCRASELPSIFTTVQITV